MKKGLFLVFIFLLLFVVTGCRTEFDNNNTKLTDMSFNKPFGYKDSRYPIGNLEDGREYEMRVYEFNDYSIEITWRDKDTFKKYTKDSEVKYKSKTFERVNGAIVSLLFIIILIVISITLVKF